MAIHVLDEAERCLQCKNPQCRKGCPISTPIPTAIKLLREGRVDEAGELLFENNPLTTVCSRICNHESQCEGHCVLGRKGAPVHFSAIEEYISDLYGSRVPDKHAEPNGKRVAIIGAGPAGLAIAVILARRGYDVTIFEDHDKIGGVLRYGIPEFRLPKTVLDDFQKRHLEANGVKLRFNTTIGQAISIDDMFEDGYSAVFAGTGVWRPHALRIPGETLGNVHYGINYLANPDSFKLGRCVIVIGVGNAAMDVARTALRHGAEHVTCFAQSSHVAASNHERSYAELEGVDFVLNRAPVRITPEGVVFIQTEGSEISENGEPPTLRALPGTEQLFEADSVIISAGQRPLDRLVNTTEGLETNPRGLLRTDDTGHTTRPGVFACGDVSTGARTVVEAVADAKRVADAMDRYMQSLEGSTQQSAEAAED